MSEKLNQLLDSMKEIADKVEDDKKEIKRIKMKKDWQSALDDMVDARDEARLAKDRLEATHKVFWGKVELDLNIYNDMTYDAESNEIIVYE